MKYVPTHKRVVRGKRLHETAEERRSKTAENKNPREISIDQVETGFLVPTIESFIETEEVRKLKDRIKLWVKAGCHPHIVGPTGCGKTRLAMQVVKELGSPTVWINGALYGFENFSFVLTEKSASVRVNAFGND